MATPLSPSFSLSKSSLTSVQATETQALEDRTLEDYGLLGDYLLTAENQAVENRTLGDYVLKILEQAFKDLDRPPPSLPEFMTVVEQGKYKILFDSSSSKVKTQALYTENIKCCIGIGVQGYDSQKQCVALGLAHLDLDASPVKKMLKKMADRGVIQIQARIAGGYAERCDKNDKDS